MSTPRIRLWTSKTATVTVSAAEDPGQKSVNVLSNIQTALDLSHMAGYTISSSWVDMLVESGPSETGTGRMAAHYGLIVLGGNPDDGDFPDIGKYEGDYFHYNTIGFKLPGVASTLVLPHQRAAVRSHSSGQRRITDIGQTAYIVCQHSAAQTVVFQFVVTLLMLMP